MNATAAVALGATMVEKHFILDRSQGGVDSAFSMEPSEFKQMVTEIRKTEAAIGEIDYAITPKKEKSRQFARSLHAVAPIAIGDAFSHQNIRSIRPGFGLAPKHLPTLLNQSAQCNYQKGDPISDFELK